MPDQPGLEAVLFDLDGTLLDTAPDMIASLNELCAEERCQPLDYDLARAHVSNGALGLLNIAFTSLNDERRERLRNRFLNIYAGRLHDATTLFPGMSELLDALDAARIPWGVVTNKPAFLTEPLMQALNLCERSGCIVSGDSLPQRKPHPDPLLHAARILNVTEKHSMYVGDAARDIQAGKAAGMTTVTALYGYIQPGDDPAAWNADYSIEHPGRLWEILTTLGVGNNG